LFQKTKDAKALYHNAELNETDATDALLTSINDAVAGY
jgi:hypothetical protein